MKLYRGQRFTACAIGLLNGLCLSALHPFAQAHDWGLSVSPSLLSQTYEEFDTSGRRLVEETSQSWAVGLSGFYRLGDDWRFTGKLNYAKPHFDYEGQTQAGAPLATTTRMRFVSLSLQVERQLMLFDHRFWLIGGLENERRQRDILPTPTVGGLNETYHTRYWMLGARTRLFTNAWLDMDTQVLRLFAGHADQDVSIPNLRAQGSGQTGRGEGLRISLPLRIKPWANITITPELAYFYTSRSDQFDLYSNNAFFAYATQPAFRQKSFGLSINIPIN